MPRVDFQQYSYYPSLLCGDSEGIAYHKLSIEDKDSILPIFELSRNRQSSDLAHALEFVRNSGARSFLLDIDKRPAPAPYVAKNPADPKAEAKRVAEEASKAKAYNGELGALLTPTNGFSAWRQLVSTFPNVIPVLQYNDARQEGRQLLRQAILFERTHASMALRIRMKNFDSACSVTSQIIAALQDPEQLLIIFDCGQGRSKIDSKIDFIQKGIQLILSELEPSQEPAIQAVCMSNSFPLLDHDGLKKIEGCDWDIWRGAREAFPFLYGDYAAVNRPVSLPAFMPRNWRATVSFALDEEWIVNRDPNSEDEKGWIRGSIAIKDHVDFDPNSICWGNDLIKSAAKGNLAGVNSARFWHAAKTNSHMHRQIGYAPRMIAEYDREEDA
jgi:hypothetical protein